MCSYMAIGQKRGTHKKTLLANGNMFPFTCGFGGASSFLDQPYKYCNQLATLLFAFQRCLPREPNLTGAEVRSVRRGRTFWSGHIPMASSASRAFVQLLGAQPGEKGEELGM